MRLRDRLTLKRDGQTVAESVPCYMGHRGQLVDNPSGTGPQPYQYTESMSPLVDLPEARVADMLDRPTSYTVTYRGRDYPVAAINPRRLPDGRLHHVTLEVERTGGV